MKIITSHEAGMFPAPAEIKINCSCPDWAGLCKHAAAVLYGVGKRLDHQPDLLFTLRQVDHMDLIAGATDVTALPEGSGEKTVAADELADVFGIELDPAPAVAAPISAPTVQTAEPVAATRTKAASRTRTMPAEPEIVMSEAQQREAIKTLSALLADLQKRKKRLAGKSRELAAR
jgi:uncharacterized Zn finger protein